MADVAIPPSEKEDHFSGHESVVNGCLDPGGSFLDVEHIEDVDPANDQVVDELCQGTTLIVFTATKVRALKEIKSLKYFFHYTRCCTFTLSLFEITNFVF